MVLGTTSGAGKSWLTTALCRWYARQGLKVAPFKAQNMSNNARVVPGLQGSLGEIGSAQYFQAIAARALPDVRMNPVLLKPEKDTASQVVVMGQVRNDYSSMPWRARSELLWPHAREGLMALMAENDVVVIEGAGSPAEINLHASDYVNMRTAMAARAACLLITDIDRGGAFAHLYGTWHLLPEAERRLIKGFVLNRFRGDAALLAPGPEQLQSMTGVPTLAVLPMWRGHGLPEEDGVFDDAPTGTNHSSTSRRIWRVAVVAYPRISNLDEFQPLRSASNVRLSWARHASQLDEVDCVILPGSKHTTSDLAWLRRQGLDQAIKTHVARGRAVLGVCGGLQMLGRTLRDPSGVETPDSAVVQGLGLLDIETRFEPDKLLKVTCARFAGAEAMGVEGGPIDASEASPQGRISRLSSLSKPDHAAGPPWHALAGVSVAGYEIRHGRTTALSPTAHPVLHDEHGHCLGWRQGSVLGVYLHGLFESDAALRALLGADAPSLDHVMDALADFIDRHFEPGALMGLLSRAAPFPS
jgi:adenosylcobyric acid synthase